MKSDSDSGCSLRPLGFPSAFLNALSTTVPAATTSSSSSTSRPIFHAPPFPRPRCLAECGDTSHSLLTEKPWEAHNGGNARAATAPWMNDPPVLPSEDVLDLSRPSRKKRKGKPRGGSLALKVRGGRSRQAMKKIVQSIARLAGKSHPDEDEDEDEDEEVEEEVMVGGALNFPLGQVLARGKDEGRAPEGEMPWVSTENPLVFRRAKKQRVVTTAELILPEALLTRLRMEARMLTKWVKAKKAGVTDDVVDEMRATWRRNELVMVKFVEPLCRNMDRAREIIEVSDWIRHHPFF